MLLRNINISGILKQLVSTRVALMHTSNVLGKNVSNIKTSSSNKWMTRQLNDPYVSRAKMEKYRCRSAFKLVEMDDKYKFLRPGQVIVDCGAAPGSWSQVAAKRVNSAGKDPTKPKGTIIAIDILGIYPIEGVHILPNNDFTNPETQGSVLSLLGERKVDCVISDMAPNATGIKDLDQEGIVRLVYAAMRFGLINLRTGGTFLCKIWKGAKDEQLHQDLLKYFDIVKHVKPAASRTDSSEFFLLAMKFKGAIVNSEKPNTS